jgi:hypothetical protein
LVDTAYRSGDYTLTATELAIRDLEKEEADEHFVIVVSDANLRRYGISPRTVRVLPGQNRQGERSIT